MDAVVERVLGFGALALAAMVAVYGFAREPSPRVDPWAPRPEPRVATSHGWPPDDVEDLTESARHFLGGVFGLKASAR